MTIQKFYQQVLAEFVSERALRVKTTFMYDSPSLGPDILVDAIHETAVEMYGMTMVPWGKYEHG